jgi:tetratricopeptide (TPR) repeat protein
LRIPSRRPSGESRSDRAHVIAVLAKMPSPADVAFPQAIRTVIEEIPDPEPVLRVIVEDRSVHHRPRFAALYALLLRLRREERYGEYGALVRQFEDDFGTEPYYHTFRAILARMRGDRASLRSSVEYSRQAVALMPDVPAVVHQLAAFWVEYLERLETPGPARDLDEAERHVDRAITLSQGKVAHYFETKGRALALRGEFEAAHSAVAHAIELEPRTARDHLRRLTQYQSTRVRIDLLQERARWVNAHREFRTELTEFKGQQLQLLGLLAAVVAFIATASNIASQTRGDDGIRLMLVASGAIAVVFGTFSLVNNSSVRRVLVAITVGCALVAAGMFVPASWMP